MPGSYSPLSRNSSMTVIACVPKMILGLAILEITRERTDPAARRTNCPLRHLTKIGLELANRHLVGFPSEEYCGGNKDGATRIKRFARACCHVRRKVVHDHGVVTPRSWCQVVLHIIEERLSLLSPSIPYGPVIPLPRKAPTRLSFSTSGRQHLADRPLTAHATAAHPHHFLLAAVSSRNTR